MTFLCTKLPSENVADYMIVVTCRIKSEKNTNLIPLLHK